MSLGAAAATNLMRIDSREKAQNEAKKGNKWITLMRQWAWGRAKEMFPYIGFVSTEYSSFSQKVADTDGLVMILALLMWVFIEVMSRLWVVALS